MMERINNDDMWKKMTLEILMQTRNSDWKVREAALWIVDHLFETIGDRYLVMLNDILPFLSEILEDEVQEVEMVAKSVVRRIEQLTGDSIQEYLK